MHTEAERPVRVDDQGRSYVLVEIEIAGQTVQMRRYLDVGGAPDEQRSHLKRKPAPR